eukprot:4253949-Amphidinium_carterae.1
MKVITTYAKLAAASIQSDERRPSASSVELMLMPLLLPRGCRREESPPLWSMPLGDLAQLLSEYATLAGVPDHMSTKARVRLRRGLRSLLQSDLQAGSLAPP